LASNAAVLDDETAAACTQLVAIDRRPPALTAG
jgi:hypothetical protein